MHDTYTQDYLAQAERHTASGFDHFDEPIDEAACERRLTHVQGRLLQGQDRHLRDWVIPHKSSVISAVAALGGAVIGGLTSIVAQWVTQRLRVWGKAARAAQRRSIKLYNEFIEEASKLFVDALEHETPNPSAMVGLYTIISRMRILSSAAVIECAEKVGDVIAETYLRRK